MENTSPSSPASSVMQGGSGAIAQQGGVAAGAGGVAIGGDVRDVYLGPAPVEKTPIPRQIPRLAPHYMPRPHDEQALVQALLDPDDDVPLTLLYGMSGTGKTSLAVSALRQLPADQFPGGILWGDLSNHEPNELLWIFMCALDNRLRRESPPRTSLRDVFGQMLSERRLLMVLANVREARQLEEMLPPNLGQCRVLAISIPRLTGLKIKYREQRLGPFTEDEALAVFAEVLGEDADARADILREISRRLDYRPQSIVSAALSFKEGRLSPNTYLRTLRESAEQSQVLGQAALDGLAVTIQALTPAQVDLFDLIGVLGDGDWHADMLAAVALRSPADVRAALDVFAGHGLVEPAGADRYRVNALVRGFARERLKRRDDYTIQSAHHLLARYCLDLAQDLEASLRFRPSQGIPDSPERAQALTLAFREALLPESSHIRKVLDWAAQRENWDLILRFAYLPYMGLVYAPVINATGALRMAFSLATFREPVVAPQTRRRIHLPIAIGSLSAPLAILAPQDEPGRFDLDVHISAGRIIDGVFCRVNLVDVQWIGVRAAGLVLRDCDLVGSRFAACDFSYSVWNACDARRTDWAGSNLRYAALRDVNLRGAVLRGVDLTGAVLESIDLRGADLRRANLSGALLRSVNLEGCRLDQVRWAGVVGFDLQFDETAALGLEDIQRAANEDFEPAQEYQNRPTAEPSRNLRGRSFAGIDWTRVDLRAADLSGSDLSDAKLIHADLRAAALTKADLSGADVRDASLRAAVLINADLSEARLESATLRAATFEGADLSNARLKKADLYSANLAGADLGSADLLQADLSHADLAGADLSGARLVRATLAEANLRGARFIRADLSHADLTNAECESADFTGAKISNEQLVLAANLGGARLTTGQVVAQLDGDYVEADLPPELDLRFARLSGKFTRISFAGRDLTGALLSGVFEGVDFSQATLAYAKLTGRFTNVNFTEAILARARLTGEFSNVDLAGAVLAKAEVPVDLRPLRLRGAKMVDGNLYDGQLGLSGDVDDARAAGIDPNDAQAMAQFYASAQSKGAEPHSIDSTPSNQ